MLIDRNTPAWRLFNLQYSVFIPELALYSTHYLRNNHVNISGDKEVDKLRINQLTQTKMTAAGLAMIIMEGYDFGVTDYKDCIQIFADVQAHLSLWHNQTNQSTHPADFPPLVELRAFESLALSVYEHAMRLEPKATENSRIFDSLVSMNRSRNFTATNKWLTSRVMEGSNLKAYVSIVDKIERYVVENSDVYR